MLPFFIRSLIFLRSVDAYARPLFISVANLRSSNVLQNDPPVYVTDFEAFTWYLIHFACFPTIEITMVDQYGTFVRFPVVIAIFVTVCT